MEIKTLLEEASQQNCALKRREEIKRQLTLKLTRIPCLQEPFRCLLYHLFEQLKEHPELIAMQWPAIVSMCSNNPVKLDNFHPSLFLG